MVDVALDDPVVGDIEGAIAERARLVAASPKQRRVFVARAGDLVEDLATYGPGGAPPLHVLDAALAVATGVRVLVLNAPDDASSAHVEWLSTAFGRRGVTVVVIGSRARVVQPATVSPPVAAPSEEERA